jgi:hypothetical protein
VRQADPRLPGGFIDRRLSQSRSLQIKESEAMLDFENVHAPDADADAIFDFDCDMDDAADIERDRLRELARIERVIHVAEWRYVAGK